jgi:hypothetical protein
MMMTASTANAFVVRNIAQQQKSVKFNSKNPVQSMSTYSGSPLFTRLSSTTADKAEVTAETYE